MQAGVPDDSSRMALSTDSALYVTVRVVPSNNVGKYVTEGKVPPLATARFAGPVTFPFDFTITRDMLTPEYSQVAAEQWERQDLIVSARLDKDGRAATRDPEDLVGRGMVLKAQSVDPARWTPAAFELQGRGLTGRLLTGGK